MRKVYFYLLFVFYSSYAFSQNYTILGNSSSMGGCNCFRLTPDAGNQAGAIFQNQTINLNNSFDFTFNVFLGCGGANGADGIVFVLTSNPNGLGNPGEGLGYAGGNQPFSFAVEFDTWQNGSVGDPSYDHIAIESGGQYNHNVAPPVPALTSQGNIDNCVQHTVRIVWDVNTNTYSVYFDGVLRQQIVIPNMVNTYFGGNPIVNWGWSGATGGGTNDQQVCVTSTSNWVAGINYQSCDLTFQFQDISTSGLGAVPTWAWNFGDGATSTQQNPTHTYAASGSYNVTLVITDASGCTNSYAHSITINPPITMLDTITAPLCNGGSNGNIAIGPSGGFGPAAGYGGYMYTWNTGTTQSSLPGIGAGTYSLTVTDGVCTSTAQYNVSQPTALAATTAHTDAPCGGQGTATINISGGTPAYSGVNWAGFTTTPGAPVSLPAGTWIADFHDANGCSALLQYTETIAALPCGITSSITKTNVTCFGGTDGTITLTVNTTTPPFNVSWSNGGSGTSLTGLPAGSYTYNYTDATPSHAFSGTVVITQPGAAIVATLATVDMSCSNSNDGQALASVASGGVSPFNYTWNPAGANNPVISNLPAGPVAVTVSDATGCTATASGTITGPPTLTLSVTTVDDSCYQSNTGSAMANVGGGNPPYTYYWSNISSAQNNLSLGIGNYTVTVTDNKGCTITGSASVNQPTAFNHTPLVPTNIGCFGASTGAISTSASGGTPAYTYTWSPTGTGSNPTALPAGQYNVTIADAHNCTVLDSIVLTQPAAALTVTTSHTDVSCNGGSDGTITATIAGGTAPYSYPGYPNPLPAGTFTIPGLPANTYAGNVTDANGCSVPVSEIIGEPAVLAVTETHVDEICYGATQGSITITPAGGTTPYSYAWNDGVLTQNRTSIAAGAYSVTVTDLHTCSTSIAVTISQPASPVLPVAVTNATCFGGNGSATANPAGGNPPYSYAWSGAGGTTGQTVAKPAGTYTVTTTDASTCQQTASLTITEPTDITVTEVHTDLKCFGDANGDITLTVSGGTGPTYTTVWNPNVGTTNYVSLLVAGTYDATVSDQANCPKTISVTLTQPTQPLTINIQSNNITCFGANDGSITIVTSGGTSPYTYAWNPNVTSTNSASGLSPATYDITVTDFNSCSVNPNVTLTEPSQPLNITPSQTDLTCYQSNDGTASVIANGGTAPYSYAWSQNVSSGPSATSLAAGNYVITVTDNNGCTVDTNFLLIQPAQLVTSETHVNVLCNGNTTGSIVITATGGTPGYTYSWNPNVSANDTANNVAAGTYSVTVSDTHACTAVQTAIITEPPLLTLSLTPTAVLCFGTATGIINSTATGGVTAYNFSASDGTSSYNSATGQFNNLIAGTYGVVVTDQNACTATATTVVTEPAALTNVADVTPATCYHYSDGSIVLNPTGGTPGYNFSLSTGSVNSTGSFGGLTANTYSFTITDANGCSLTDSSIITEPDSVTIDVTPTPVEVKLGDNLQLSTTTNAPGSVTYNWTPNFGLSCYDCANPVFDGIYSQPYHVVVTTQAGCTGTAEFVVTVIPNYDIFIPNAFTPNGDGVNDFWQLFGNMAALKQVEVMVFNRIGEKVFESTDINFKWDGSFLGKDSPPGVYTYVAKFVWLNNHSDAHYRGSITLLK